MSLGSGDRLGPYEIRGKIGEGGMGAVYRAVDARLDREVAIKVLPAEFVGDPERRARFEREAKLLASLNHPNIAQLYGVEEGPGGTLALVLELVEGVNLDARISSGPLAVDEALAIAGEIAAALAAAHDKGIVHRDLKPQNVRITPSGAVKLLDFGLAKALAAGPSTPGELANSPTLVNSPTLTAGATELGVILGTAAYMSPEQARGRPTDRRADVWAFGCVLYEMLTGESLFAGETASDTLAAVLRRDIPWQRLPADLPPAVRLLLRRCLARDPKERLRDLGDAGLLLREREEPRPDAGAMRTRRPWLAPSAALVAAVVGLFAGWAIFDRGAAVGQRPSRSALLAVRLPTGVTAAIETTTGQTQVLAISRDAQWIAFVGNEAEQQRIYLRRLDEKEVRAVPGSENGTSPFFSPDGKWIGFFARGKLRKSAIAGGEPVELCDVGLDRGGLWLPDGTIVFSPGAASGLFRIPAAGGEPVELTRLDETHGERSHRWPALLPGGRELAFTVGTIDKPGDYEDAAIDAVDLATGTRRRIYEGASMIRFTPSGHALLGHAGELQAVAWNGAPGTSAGEPVKVLLDVRGEPASGVVFFDVSDDGTLVYAERNARGDERTLAWVDRSGALTPLAAPPREYRLPRLSPDGRRIAVGIGRGRGGESDIWIVDVGSGTLQRLTFDGRSEIPTWSRDGESVYYRTGSPRANLFAEKRADGSTEARIVAELDAARARGPLDLAPDGTLLFSEDSGAGYGNDILMLAPGEKEPRPVARTSDAEINGALTRDGRYVAYSVNVSGGAEYIVQTFPALTGRWQVGQGANGTLRWARDGKALFVRSPGAILEVPVDPGPPFRSGSPRELFPFHYVDSEDVYTSWDVAPDGRFLVLRSLADPALADRLVVGLDWFVTLRRLVPAAGGQ